ncbi:malate synthase [Haloactinopolyspora alba]|uniref:Malate synthase n=1 Tax=Haloactinopolyspora alba TaxID=648780 RepID=A0A2P8DZX0_9ACTN|nr:malate synthase A [Haloactinopolyspora alba]PSL02771.1 malate synthase [Haloactinopolyspora alba]
MSDVELTGPVVERSEEVLTPDALEFVAALQRRFAARRDDLLSARAERRRQVMQTGRLDFDPATAGVRESDWQVAPAPADLRDRRVEITGPTERKMAVNALNSGAKVWLADLEDSNTPHWGNVVAGQVNLYDAVRRTLAHVGPDGKQYRLRADGELATIVMRPRGWHLDERHVVVDGAPTVGALVDFGLYFFHNAKELLERGSGPYFYLPKLESHLEARLWNDVFVEAQRLLDVPRGSVRATVLIETIPAAFEMDEILYELREHASGLNAGRWDYLFSMIKYFRDAGSEFVLPDRATVTMTAPFMRAYTELLVSTCHRRGAVAMGGMAAFIPSRRDPEVNERALAKVRADKEREAADGFDGSWVAHPDLVPVCREVFDSVLGDRPNQVERQRTDVTVSADELLNVAATGGAITEAGVRGNVSVAVQYLAAWLGGNGAAAISNLMEDAATAEIARAQIWHWSHNAVTADGVVVTPEYVRTVLDEELTRIRDAYGDAYDEPRFAQAREVFERVALADEFADFLTIPAYDLIDTTTPAVD